MSKPIGDKATVLIVENREKTELWAHVARNLIAIGHDVHWVVQNPIFAKDLPGTVHLLPFPNQRDAKQDHILSFPILETDRGRQYFEAGSSHYPHYASQINHVFDLTNPTVVVGESTLFHELMAVAIAEERGVPFLHPTAERYPTDRFVIFEGITQSAYIGSGDHYPPEDASDYIQKVVNGSEKPSYMSRASGWAETKKKAQWALSRTQIFEGRLRGERFNTPSLRRKFALGRHAKANVANWRRLERPILAHEKAIMYPMHVAPEANIDVWGRPFQNQAQVIARLLSAAPSDVMIAVKANPYPKYEITDELLDMARLDERLRLLPFEMKMPEAMAQCVGAVTVSGTVSFEAIFGKGRCISLRHPIVEATCPRHAAASPEEAIAKLIEDPEAGIGTYQEAIKLLQAITARSFPGFVSDPFSSPSCLHPDNITLIAHGVEIAISKALADASNAEFKKAVA